MKRGEKIDKLMKGIVKEDNGCWVWVKGRFSKGYGAVVIGNKTMGTHRLAYLLFKGPLKKGKNVCHHCDNPPCCNPDHLFLGTHADNQRDKCNKGREARGKACVQINPATGERNGNAKLTDKQVVLIREEYNGKYGSMARLAKEHGVSVDQIRNVVRGNARMSGVETVDWETRCDKKAKRAPRPDWVKEKIRKTLKGRPRPKEVVDKIKASRWGNRTVIT